MVGLKKVASILDEVAYVPRRIYKIRWLSRIKVVSDFVKSMPLILTFLEEKSNDDEMAKTLFTRLSNVYNQVILHHLDDLLRPIEILSLKLQKRNLHPFDALLHIQSMMVELEETFLDDNVQLCSRSFNLLKSKVEDGSILLSGGGLVNTVLSSCEKTMRDFAKSVLKNTKKRMLCNDDIISKFSIFKLGENSKKN
uniref:Uncharacterized protein n=1 Tax=Romanomermis culicivorax TaxID=13658 RepID=A0A915KLU2_ROMCU